MTTGQLNLYLNRVLKPEEVLNLEHAATKLARNSFKLTDASRSTNPKVVLKDVFELLEEYGPMWYTEELHNRMKTALASYN